MLLASEFDNLGWPGAIAIAACAIAFAWVVVTLIKKV